MDNVIELLKKEMQKHKVEVVLSREVKERQFFLIETKAKTSTLEDFLMTFGTEVTPLHIRIAKKVFGEGQKVNTYGVLYDEEMKPVFAFNRLFADYDRKTKKIVYRNIDDILLDDNLFNKPEDNRENDFPQTQVPFRPYAVPPHSHFGPNNVIKYALLEKPKE